MFAGSMPNAATPSAFVDSATMCRATASSPSASVIQSRIVCAFVIVSSVVNVFDATMTSVSAGSRPRVARTTSLPSTLERKRTSRSSGVYASSAIAAISGPR